ncbi:MAG TPA: hypothetical protein VGO00_00355, partial [Kofleriaceae bacterium]|nr:hypothetical protein [Kofleriaceae bacterium]
MATSPPPQPPGGRKHPNPSAPPMGAGEDFADFEGDPTNINQIPQPPSSGAHPLPAAGQPARPSSGSIPPVHPSSPMFAAGSPHLSHVGMQPQMTQVGYGVQPMGQPQQL